MQSLCFPHFLLIDGRLPGRACETPAGDTPRLWGNGEAKGASGECARVTLVFIVIQNLRRLSVHTTYLARTPLKRAEVLQLHAPINFYVHARHLVALRGVAESVEDAEQKALPWLVDARFLFQLAAAHRYMHAWISR